MSVIVPPVIHPSDRNAFTRPATHIVAAVVVAFLSILALSAPLSAQSPPPVQAPNPAFPTGTLTATILMIEIGPRPILQWSVQLPPNANASDYVFRIRQKLYPSEINYDMVVESEGATMAALRIPPGWSTFELSATDSATNRFYLLDSTSIGPYLPTATVAIRSEDPYAALPRTRADRPFYVDLTINGLLSDPNAPDSLKSVTLHRHGQSYGATGTGDWLDRSLATLLQQSSITTNGTTTVTVPAPAIPVANGTKARGEERFTILSQSYNHVNWETGSNYNMFPSELDSQLVQIWPAADATISGIAQGQVLGASTPQLTIQLNDLYPDSTTYAQVYKGGPQAGITGTILPGSTVTINDSVPANRTITLDNYGTALDSDGIWTMELLTQTPFGIDRITHLSFIVQRSGMTLADWRQSHFGSSSNSGDGADDHDFDHDGLANLIEYAFGSDPKQSSSAVLPAPERSGDHFTIRFTPPASVTGLLYGAEWSTTLAPDTWIAVPDTGTLPEHVFTVPTADKPRLYLRLKVTSP